MVFHQLNLIAHCVAGMSSGKGRLGRGVCVQKSHGSRRRSLLLPGRGYRFHCLGDICFCGFPCITNLHRGVCRRHEHEQTCRLCDTKNHSSQSGSIRLVHALFCGQNVHTPPPPPKRTPCRHECCEHEHGHGHRIVRAFAKRQA